MIKELLDSRTLSEREYRLISAVMVVSALPEASTIDNFEAKQLLDKAIRLTKEALEEEVRIYQQKDRSCSKKTR